MLIGGGGGLSVGFLRDPLLSSELHRLNREQHIEREIKYINRNKKCLCNSKRITKYLVEV